MVENKKSWPSVKIYWRKKDTDEGKKRLAKTQDIVLSFDEKVKILVKSNLVMLFKSNKLQTFKLVW